MLEYLQSVFGLDIDMVNWVMPSNTPFYIRDGYSFQKLTWRKQSCVFAKPRSSSVRLPALKKQLGVITALCEYPCALELDELSSQQRKNLLMDHIPFVAAPNQVYLPFWGCAFTERYKTATVPDEIMTPMTQLVFLHLFYSLKGGKTTASAISAALGIAKVTVSRAVDMLVSTRMFSISVEGKRKWLSFTTDESAALEIAMKYMRSPVEKRVYVRELPSDIPKLQGGIQALSQISMVSAGELDGSLVLNKKTYSSIPKDLFINEKDFFDFGGCAIEVWYYDANLLSDCGRVDDLSLLLSLMSNEDERVQMGLDGIREKYGLPINTQT